MLNYLKNITGKSLIVLLAAAVLVLNMPAVIQCSNILMGNDCCQIQKMVKPCCVKSLKIPAGPRLTGNCGCSMKESQASPDLYNDLFSGNRTNYQNASIDYEQNTISIISPTIDFYSENYSPPSRIGNDTYLTNLNLRI
jgi:hypothetical protein